MQLHVAKVNLNTTMSPKSHSKKRSYFQQVSTKRLRYCYKKRQIQESSPQPVKISYKFNDSNCFYQSNGNQINFMRQSNLLNKHQINQKGNQIENLEGKKLSRPTKTTSTKIINVQIFNESKLFGERPNSAIYTKTKMRSKSAFDNRKAILQKYQKSNSNKKQCRNINPYTKQQYLYFRKKQKERMKKNLLQIKKHEMLHNILKPCQIFQKQINNRDHNRIQLLQTDFKSFSYQHKKHAKSPLHRTLTARPKQDDVLLQPWQFKPWHLNEDCFI